MSIEAMKQALEALENVLPFAKENFTNPSICIEIIDAHSAITSLRQAIANEALDKKAENARELGLDYEPVQSEKNQFNPDWDAMAVMVEEQQRMAKRIEELEQAEKQEPVADLVECGNCHEGLSDMDHVCKKCLGAGWIRNPDTTPQPQQELVAWKNAAIRLGEELSSVGPDGYYNMTAKQWLDWAMDQQPRGKNSLPQPQREWIGLTDEEANELWESADSDWELMKRVEAKLKEKNNG